MKNESKSSITTNEVDDLEVNEAALVRKIDWHIVPILFAAYFLQFLDKVIVNVSSQPSLPPMERQLTVSIIVCQCHGNAKGYWHERK